MGCSGGSLSDLHDRGGICPCQRLGRRSHVAGSVNLDLPLHRNDPGRPLQITTTFQIVGDELAEVETVPRALNFSERYKILDNSDTDLVAAISIAKIGEIPPPGIGAVVIIIAKQNGLFQQSGAILGLRTGAPTLGHCESQ
jgi:hypothetical protein